MPLYRPRRIYRRGGVDLDRASLANWCGTAAHHLPPAVDRMLTRIKRSFGLFNDEIRSPALGSGVGKTTTGYLWALAHDDRPWTSDEPPAVVFTTASGRRGSHAVDRCHAGLEITLASTVRASHWACHCRPREGRSTRQARFVRCRGSEVEAPEVPEGGSLLAATRSREPAQPFLT